MITYEDECCGCAVPGYPCMGSACPNRNVPHMYCDNCGDDVEKLYKYVFCLIHETNYKYHLKSYTLLSANG